MKRTLMISPQFVMMVCRPSDYARYYKVIGNALPDDVHVVEVRIDHILNKNDSPMIGLVLESTEFTEDTPEPLPAVEFTEVRRECCQ